jgi:hypothetical protein
MGSSASVAINVTIARYVLGVACLVIVAGTIALAAVLIRRRLLVGWSGVPARLAESVIGTALLIGILELLGTLGLFRLAPTVLACTIVAVVAIRFLSRTRAADTGATRRPVDRFQQVSAGVAVLAVGAVVAEWACPTLKAYDLGVHVLDSMWYHLPWAASFAQTGHVTPLRFTDVEFLTAFYPANAEMVHGLGILLLTRDTLSPVINFLWLGLAMLAAYCVGRSRGVGAISVLGLALVMATPMIDLSQPGGADNDILGVFLFLAAAALLLEGLGHAGDTSPMEEPSRRNAYVLAGVAAGLAAGTKLTFLVPVGALTLGVVALALWMRDRRAAGLWLGAEFLAGGFWYVRNLIAVGNPLPWTSLGALPTPAPPQQGNTTFSVSHYLTNTRILRHFFEPALSSGLGRWWPAIVAAAILGPLLCLLPGAGRTIRLLALVALASVVAYLFTPNSAMGPEGDPLGMSYNVRYVTPGLSLAFVVFPLAPSVRGAFRQASVLVGLAAVVIATLATGSLWPDKYAGRAVIIGIVALAACGFAVASRLGDPRRRLTVIPIRALALAGAMCLVAAGTAGGYAWQRHYLRLRYAYRPGVSHLSQVWDLFRRIHHARVGLVGTYGSYFAYPLLGVDDSNVLEYVAHHGPHGSFTPITSCRQWRVAVNAGHFQYLVTTPRRDFWQQRRLFPSPEDAWTVSDPVARPVYRRRVLGQPIGVYRLRGLLDPARCPAR